MFGHHFPRFLRRLRKHRRAALMLVVGLVLVGSLAFAYQPHSTGSPAAGSRDFIALERQMTNGQVKRIHADPDQLLVHVVPVHGKAFDVGVPGDAGFHDLITIAKRRHIALSSNPYPAPPSGIAAFMLNLPRILMFLLMVGLLFPLLRMMPSRRGIGKRATSEVSFADVAGCDEAIEELAEIRDFLADPEKYARLGARVPKGVLLYGDAGTGKTLLAKAVAGEADVPFYFVSGSEFIEMFAGLGANRVRSLFKRAKEEAPAIIFIDELDAVGRNRSGGGGGDGATREADQTLNQLLVEMDGFDAAESPVIVMAASNRLEMLDPALTRKGRFDRHIAVDAPDRAGRLKVLEIHAHGKPLAGDVDLEKLAAESAGMTGADLANLLNEAALHAARRNASAIEPQDIDSAFTRVVIGARKSTPLRDEERQLVAFHEAGHAIVGELLKTSREVRRISIIPHGRSGGHTLSVSDEDVRFETVESLRRGLAELLAGRAAEEIAIGEISTGAGDDLQRASAIVRRMLGEFGMGSTLGLLVAEDGKANEPLEREMKELLEAEYNRAKQLLGEHRETLERIAVQLLEQETIERTQFLELMAETLAAEAA